MTDTMQWLTKALVTLLNDELGSEMQIQNTNAGLSLSVPAGGSGSNPTSITLDGLHIDATNGLEGHLHLDTSNTQGLQVSLIDGFTLALTGFDLQLQNAGLTTADIRASLTIPYFTHANGAQEKIDVDVGIRHDGSLTLTLAPQQSNPDHMTPDGLLKLSYNIGSGVSIELDIDSLEFDNPSPHVYQLVLGGKLLLSTGLQWPTFEFKGLRIDNQGHVQLDGGWIDLPASTALDYYGFNLSLQKLGFGSDTTGRWIGFNGDIHLVEGIPLGGSVQGMRLNLDDGSLSFQGVSVSFEIPGVLSFSGAIEHLAANDVNQLMQQGIPEKAAQSMAQIVPSIFPANIFAGDVDVTIYPAGDLEVDAKFIVGHFGGTPVFFLVLDAELPVGIPIFLDIALYGLEGLFASNLRPDPTKVGQTWWDWYKYSPGSNTQVDYSATDVNKWLTYPQPGALALGMGATIGTEADDGFTASAGITFILMLPGPVITFVGKAKVLSKRVSNAGDYDSDAYGISFDAMATYDGSADTFDLDIDAQYKIPIVMDIEGSAVLHVDAKNGFWYFGLGLPPHDKRIKARIFDLFEADSYFVVSDTGLQVGSYVGYNKEWDFGPLSVSLNAYMAMLAAIQWSPLVLAGGIELHGDAHLDAFGVGLGVSVDALLEGKAPDPFWVHGEFDVELDLPWPLPDVGATVSLTWGGDKDDRPASPLPLSHIDATLVDHVGTSERYTLLAHRPSWSAADPALVYDSTTPGLLVPTQDIVKYWAGVWASQQNPPVNPPTALTDDNVYAILPDMLPGSVPYATVIPQDAHFTLNFAHPICDQTGGFTNGTGNPPTEWTSVSLPPALPKDDMSNINPNSPSPQWIHTYDLKQVALYEYTGGQWQIVAAQPPKSTQPLLGAWLSTSKTAPNCQSSDNTRLKIIPQQSATNASLGILPDGQRMYALKVVTSVTSQHTDKSNSQTDAPIIEFAYFQTASGPGVGIIDAQQQQLSHLSMPIPSVSAPYAQQGKQVPAGPLSSAFPLGGQLLDLHTYTQWSWPGNGDIAAYYGYDLNVEFNESYVYNLYGSTPDTGGNPVIHIAAATVSSTTQIGSFALHMRCVDRNNQHVLLVPDAIHVPSIQQQSALESREITLPMPTAILNDGGGTHLSQVITSSALSNIRMAVQQQARLYEQQQLLDHHAQSSVGATLVVARSAPIAGDGAAASSAIAASHTLKVQEQVALQELATRAKVVLNPAQLGNPSLIPPSLSSIIIIQILEEEAAQEARRLWPQPLLPRTRYTLDVVAGPLGGVSSDRRGSGSAFLRLVANNYQDADAITIRDALVAFYDYEDSLTTLQRVQFTTSRYATFTAHLANAVEQSRIAAGIDPGKPEIAPIRIYAASIQVQTWLNDVQNGDGTHSALTQYQNCKNTYTQAKDQIASFVGNFDPKGDNLPPHLPPLASQPLPGLDQLPSTPDPNWPFPGQAGLRVNRQVTQQAWTDFWNCTSQLFDKVITALQRADLVSNQHVPPPPDTELSEFVDSAGRVQAFLLASPEPLPWRYIWKWIVLQATSDADVPLTVLPLWSADGTRALLIPLEQQSSSIGQSVHAAQTAHTIHPDVVTNHATGAGNVIGGGIHLPPILAHGQYGLTISFHGNIGAEAPCITRGIRESIEDVTFAPLTLLPSPIFKPPH